MLYMLYLALKLRFLQDGAYLFEESRISPRTAMNLESSLQRRMDLDLDLLYISKVMWVL
jgi:hypothetical protein